MIKGNTYLKLFWGLIILSFSIWLIALIYNPQCQQFNLFFDRMHNFWADATNVTGMIVDMNPYYGEAKGSYPPLAYLLFYPLMRVSSVPEFTYSHGAKYLLYYYQPIWTMLFVVFTITLLLIFYIICVDQLKRYPYLEAMMTVIALFLSYPMLYTFERGNILIVSVIATSIFVFYYDSSCSWKKEIALLSLAIASGIKITPAIFGILLIKNKDWSAAFRTVCYGLLFFIVPFCFFKGGIHNLPQMLLNAKYFLSTYIWDSINCGTGLVSSYVKYAKLFLGEGYEISFRTYSMIEMIKYELTVVLFLGLFHYKEKWKEVLNITLILLILPKVSLSYCVLYIIPFTILFLDSLKNSIMTVDKYIIYVCLIMIYFVYRCSVSDFFNFNFAIPVLLIIGLMYSLKEFINLKQVLPLNMFSGIK